VENIIILIVLYIPIFFKKETLYNVFENLYIGVAVIYIITALFTYFGLREEVFSLKNLFIESRYIKEIILLVILNYIFMNIFKDSKIFIYIVFNLLLFIFVLSVSLFDLTIYEMIVNGEWSKLFFILLIGYIFFGVITMFNIGFSFG
jgi:hypothetical protein